MSGIYKDLKCVVVIVGVVVGVGVYRRYIRVDRVCTSNNIIITGPVDLEKILSCMYSGRTFLEIYIEFLI